MSKYNKVLTNEIQLKKKNPPHVSLRGGKGVESETGAY